MLAFVACENVVRDVSGKNSLIGVFDLVLAPAVPVNYPGLYVYAKIADAHDVTSLSLQLVHGLGNENLLPPSAAPVHMEIPTFPIEAVFRIGPFALPKYGRYDWRLLANDEFIGSTPFSVLHEKPTRENPTGMGNAT